MCAVCYLFFFYVSKWISNLYNTCQVNEFIAGVGTDAPDVEEENVFSRPSVGYDDMWAKTLLETNDMEV